MLQIIAGSWPIAVMFIATLAALLALKVMRIAERNREEDRAYRASQALTVRHSAGLILFALCTSLVLQIGTARAADKAVPPPAMTMSIGKGAIGKPVKVRKAETDEHFIRRVSRPYPGKME